MDNSSLYIHFIRKALNIYTVPLVLIISFGAITFISNHTSLASYQHALQQRLQTIREIVTKNIEESPRYSLVVTATAYSSTMEQTDDTPCIAAQGFDLCKHNRENVIASNFLIVGTKVRFPEFDPDTIYIVVDSMNDRFIDNRVDFWKRDKERAHSFGKQYLLMEIY